MAINSNKYVNIVSRVGGLDAVPSKELLLRVYTDNDYLPFQSVTDFDASELSRIKVLFGTSSREYAIAQFYFAFISKQTTSPRKIQFARFNAKAVTANYICMTPVNVANLAKKGSAVTMDITINGATKTTGNIDLSKATKADEIATAIQTELVKLTDAPSLANATVTSNKFGGLTIDTKIGNNAIINSIELSDKTLQTDLGFDQGQDAINSKSGDKQTPTDALDVCTENNNNYGSFVFLGFKATKKDEQKPITEIAKWVAGRDIEFMYLLGATPQTYPFTLDAVKGYSSVGLTYLTDDSDIAYVLPAAIMASQDFTQPAASTNYMFQMAEGLIASVNQEDLSNRLDEDRVNYYGRTQESGVMLDFYQRGVLQGGDGSPKEMGVHANEQWLKSSLKAQFLSMFLAMGQVPASLVGQGICSSYLDAVVTQAKTNGSITIGKVLTPTQINYVTQLTGNNKAYLDVQNKGCWYTTSIGVDKDTGSDILEYLLVYAKTDSIDKVEGRHVLV